MRSNLVRKAIALTLTASMCVSLAACNNEPDPTVTETSETTTEATTTTTIATTETTETSETTASGPDFSKNHAYRLYEGTDNSMTLDMKVNIDDYISPSDEEGLEVFELFKLASDLGWREKGVYSYDDYLGAMAEDPNQTKVAHSNWYSYDFGDHRSVFIINEYIEDIPDMGRRQLSLISFEYMKNDFRIAFYDDAADNPAHAKVQLHFSYHYDNIECSIEGQHCLCSRDDAIIIAYSLWAISQSAEDNTVASEPFEDFRTESGVLQLP